MAKKEELPEEKGHAHFLILKKIEETMREIAQVNHGQKAEDFLENNFSMFILQNVILTNECEILSNIIIPENEREGVINSLKELKKLYTSKGIYFELMDEAIQKIDETIQKI